MADHASAVRGKGRINNTGTGEIRVKDAGGTTKDLGTIDIEGRVYKPSVFYVLARGDLHFKWLKLSQDFTGRILSGALKRPF